MARIIQLVLLCTVLGCAGAKVRYDAAPSPVDQNQHTVLMEVDCGDGVLRPGFGQVGCNFEPGKEAGSVTIHTPLPGSIAMISRACGVDQTDFHNDKGGSFKYDLKPLFPDGPNACVIDVFVAWQLPPKLTSEYPLRGMIGKIYLRRRQSGQGSVGFEWSSGEKGDGIAWSQFRELASRDGQPVLATEPLSLKMKSPVPVTRGLYRLYGCGQGVSEASFVGDTITLERDTLLGPNPKKSGCMLFGWMTGIAADGSTVSADAVAGIEIFGAKVMKLAASVRAENGQICYDAENSVSLAVLNYGKSNEGSNDLSHCFKAPAGLARLGLFTHQGRALYALIEDGQIKEIFQ